MKSQLKAFGKPDFDSLHRAIIETNLPEFESQFKQSPKAPRFVKLKKGNRECGCILAEITSSNTNKISLDRFKQWHLHIHDGDTVDVEILQPVEAQKVELLTSADFAERDKARLIGKPLTKGEKTALRQFTSDMISLTVKNMSPSGVAVVTNNTEIVLAVGEAGDLPITYKDIGGLSKEIKAIRELVEFPLRFPDIYESLGVSHPKGIILYGPPGTGKTMIARALANAVDAKFYQISGPEVFSMWYGESEKKVRELFETAEKNAPAVILIDELDALAPQRERARGELEQRIVTTLLTKMDGLKQLKGVVVVATTNRINSIDNALRGRFAREIHIGVPDLKGRREILDISTTGRMPLAPDIDLDILAEKTVGYVGRDITNLCREAAYNALRRSFPADAFEKGKVLPHETIQINQSDFEAALSSIAPSAMREFLIETPKVAWEDIGGLDEVKRLLVENITYAITKPDVFKKAGVKPARGILLYGPPGTGKTLLAKAVASQCGANFISIKGPEIRSKWVGESEERIRFIFSRAREAMPCVIFFDEIDAAAGVRGRDASGSTDTIVNQILTEMDGIESADGVFVIGATNRVELLDPAILRPGRFDYRLEIPLPDAEARKAIFKVHLKGKPLAPGIDIEPLIELTNKFSGAEIAEVCREAAWEAIRDAKFEAVNILITTEHFRKTIRKIKQLLDN